MSAKEASPAFQFYPKDFLSVRSDPSPLAWRAVHAEIQFGDIPDVGGCYAWFGDGHLLIIGQTSRLRTRLRHYDVRQGYCGQWFTQWGQFDHVVLKIKPCRRYGEWAMREIRLIRRLRPRHNQRIA